MKTRYLSRTRAAEAKGVVSACGHLTAARLDASEYQHRSPHPRLLILLLLPVHTHATTGMTEPVAAGVDAGVRLGLGKQAQDDIYTAAENINRKKLEVEIQAEEAPERRERREVREMGPSLWCGVLRWGGRLPSRSGCCDKADGSCVEEAAPHTALCCVVAPHA